MFYKLKIKIFKMFFGFIFQYKARKLDYLFSVSQESQKMLAKAAIYYIKISEFIFFGYINENFDISFNDFYKKCSIQIEKEYGIYSFRVLKDNLCLFDSETNKKVESNNEIKNEFDGNKFLKEYKNWLN